MRLCYAGFAFLYVICNNKKHRNMAVVRVVVLELHVKCARIVGRFAWLISRLIEHTRDCLCWISVCVCGVVVVMGGGAGLTTVSVLPNH